MAAQILVNSLFLWGAGGFNYKMCERLLPADKMLNQGLFSLFLELQRYAMGLWKPLRDTPCFLPIDFTFLQAVSRAVSECMKEAAFALHKVPALRISNCSKHFDSLNTKVPYAEPNCFVFHWRPLACANLSPIAETAALRRESGKAPKNRTSAQTAGSLGQEYSKGTGLICYAC